MFFSVASALLAVAAYHFVFGSTPSWDVRTVAATVLFCAGQTAAAAASWRPEPAPSGGVRANAAPRGGFLRGIRRPSGPTDGGSLTRVLRRLWAFLTRLLRPLRAPLPVAPPRPAPSRRTELPARVPSLSLLLADAVVRRGPPARPPQTV
ncbi:hypothetical protein AB0N81_21170 [Streptomyces sp. NPDC093510]|uniref:hypothetical protein n=1 Tax=Streptomyces sp. NPDC093510 TaxID=3155199 RepID=UPI003426050E